LLAANFKATVTRLLVGSRPFPMILSPLMRLSGASRSQETKMVFVLPFDHVPTRLAENRSGGHDVNTIDLS
jgi:hypothetical protein